MRPELALARKVQAFRNRTLPDGPPVAARQWYEFRNVDTTTDGTNTDLYIYDEISWFGITAMDLVRELMMIETDTITVRLNSPGGDVWDGIAIKNALLTHRAKVNVIVDGQAASIATVIMLAGEQITMMPGARLLIHNASTICWGTSTDMLECATLLEEVNGEIAGLYAKRTGKPAQFFRDAMSVGATNMGTRYDADSAVELGLADAVGDESTKTTGPAVVPAAAPDGGEFWDKASPAAGGFVAPDRPAARLLNVVCQCGPSGWSVVDRDGQHLEACTARGDLTPRIVNLPDPVGVNWEVVPFDGCCDICQDVVDSSPYPEDDLPEVPVHPNCDCELQVAYGVDNHVDPITAHLIEASSAALAEQEADELVRTTMREVFA